MKKNNIYIVFILLVMAMFLTYGCGAGIGFVKKDNSTPDNESNDDTHDKDDGTGDGGNTDGGDNVTGGDNGTTGDGGVTKPTKRLLAGGLVSSNNGASGGLYYSDDNGKTWNKATSANSTLDLSKSWFSFADLGNGVVLAGSGNNETTGINYSGYGIILSEDYGKTWKKTTMIEGVWNSLLHVDGDIVLAGAGLGNDKLKRGGVWRSEDGGKTWKASEPLSAFCNGQGCTDLVTVLKVPVDAMVKVRRDFIISSMMATKTITQLVNITMVYSSDTGKTWKVFHSWLDMNFTPVGNYNQVTHTYDFAFTGNNVISATSRGIATSPSLKDISEGVALDNLLLPASWNVVNGPEWSFTSVAVLKSGTVLAGNFSDQTTANRDPWPSGIYRLDGSNINNLTPFRQTNMKRGLWYDIVALDDGSAIGACDYFSVDTSKSCSGLWQSSDDGMTWKQIGFDKQYFKALAVVRGE